MKFSFFARIPLVPLDVRPDIRINGWTLHCQTSGVEFKPIESNSNAISHFHWGPPTNFQKKNKPIRESGRFDPDFDPSQIHFEGLIFGAVLKTNTFYFLRDPAGHTPIYYYIEKNQILISTHIFLLKKWGNLSLQLDESGFIDYFLVGRRPFENLSATPFQKVEQLQPGQMLCITKTFSGEFHHALETVFDYRLPSRRLPFLQKNLRQTRDRDSKYFIDEFRALFLQAVERRSLQRNGVLVSGGLDSSSVFSALATNAEILPPIGLTYSSKIFKEAEETAYVQALEEKYKIPIQPMELKPTHSLMDDLKEQMRITELPIVDYQWSVTREALTWFQSQEVSNVLTGHWGDQVLFSDEYLIDLMRAGNWSLVQSHINEYKQWMSEEEWQFRKKTLYSGTLKAMVPNSLRGITKKIYKSLKPDPLLKSKPYLSQKSVNQLKHSQNQIPNQNLKATFHSQSLFTQVRSKYATQCLDWNFKVGSHFGIWMRFPFLDPDLVQLLLAMPGEMQNLNGRPRGILRESLKGLLPTMIQNRTWKADFTAITNSNVATNSQTILQFLNQPLRLVDLGLVDSIKFRNYVDQIRVAEPELIASPSSSRSWGLMEVVALELWLREWEL